MIHGDWHTARVADTDEVMKRRWTPLKHRWNPAKLDGTRQRTFAAMEFTARSHCPRSVMRRRSRPKCYWPRDAAGRRRKKSIVSRYGHRRNHGWKVGGTSCWVYVDPFLFPALFVPPVLALFAVALFCTFLPYTFPLKFNCGVCISAISSPLCPGAASQLRIFFCFAIASLNFVIRSTTYICHPLKSVVTSRNDSQSQKVGGDQINNWSPSSQKVEERVPRVP